MAWLTVIRRADTLSIQNSLQGFTVMRFSKLITLLSCSLLLIGVLSPFVGAQKKDKDKDKNKDKSSSPPVPAVIPPTPYTNVRRENLLNGLQIITLERPGDTNVKCDLVIR